MARLEARARPPGVRGYGLRRLLLTLGRADTPAGDIWSCMLWEIIGDLFASRRFYVVTVSTAVIAGEHWPRVGVLVRIAGLYGSDIASCTVSWGCSISALCRHACADRRLWIDMPGDD